MDIGGGERGGVAHPILECRMLTTDETVPVCVARRIGVSQDYLPRTVQREFIGFTRTVCDMTRGADASTASGIESSSANQLAQCQASDPYA